jgi:hypothetical protein
MAAAGAAALWAQSGREDELLLARSRERVLQVIERMPRYTCTETVERREFEQMAARLKQQSCDRILAARASGAGELEFVRSDRLRLQVQVGDGGMEMFSWPGSSRLSSERVQDFAGEGVIGTGAFGPFLIDILANPGVKFWPEGSAKVDGVELRQYRYLVPLASSHYRVAAGGATRVVPYEGRLWLDPASADLRRLLVRTGELSRSTGNCEASTTVDFSRARIGGGEHLLASRSVLRVVRRDAAELENVTTYGACQEFRGETAIRYEGEEARPASDGTGAVVTIARTATQRVTPFPPGVRVTIRFASGFDRRSSAAGDVLLGRVRHTEAQPKRRLLPEAGSDVRCRVTRFEEDVRALRLNVAVACEAVQADGGWAPFDAVPDKGEDLSEYVTSPWAKKTTVQRRGYARRPPTFVFRTTDPNAETGPISVQWITIVPAKQPPAR